jgi:archaeal flagellar protein FlaJ
MKTERFLERIKRLLNKLKTRSEKHPDKTGNKKTEKVHHEGVFSYGSPQLVAHQVVGNKIGRILPLFDDLDFQLRKSGLKINFRAYISLTVFTTILAAIGTLISVPLIAILAFRLTFMPAALFGIGGSLFTIAFSVICFYVYPLYRSDKLRRDLEDELPFTTGYMSILTSAGVSPEKIFHSLSDLSIPLAVSAEAKDVVRNVNLFGKDIISALEEESNLTPSARFREMLEGFIATIHSGGSSTAYLREKSRQYMKLKRISLKKFSDTLSVLSEFYVALLLTGPLLLVVMLSVMAMLGGGNLGILSPDLLLNLLTYLGLPLGAIIFLIILDAVTPRW